MTKKLRKAVSSLEYAMLASLIGFVSFSVISVTGGTLEGVFCSTQRSLLSNALDYSGCSNADRLAYAKSIGYGRTLTDISTFGASGWSCRFVSECHGLPIGASDDAAFLNFLNQQDPVVQIYGLSDHNGNPVTTLSPALDALSNGSIDTSKGLYQLYKSGVQSAMPISGAYDYEVLTKSGSVYGYYWNNALFFRNLKTGDLYVDDGGSTLTDIGQSVPVSSN